jgi:voltage-gated potassium channel
MALMNNRESHKVKLYTIIFEADTKAGRNFDLALIAAILLSVLLIIMESVPEYRILYGNYFYVFEWILTAVFIIEYFLRIYSVTQPRKYIFSFFGIIDFVSSFATVFSLFIPGVHSFLVIRSLRLIRIFRILKLARYFSEGMTLLNALRASRVKISVFLFSVLIIVLVAGTTMYIIEGPEAGFTNIPISMYWAIVTLTTVGYGDIAPMTNLGRMIASLLMIVGYAIIAVPTGIVTSELTSPRFLKVSNKACPGCGSQANFPNSNFCSHCGVNLSQKE